MARARPTTMCQANELVIHDRDGRPLLIAGKRTITVFSPNGDTSVYERTAGIRLVDGLIWTPEMLTHNPPVLLTVCDICRNPPASFLNRERATHGLLSVRNARTCGGSRCGRISCPRHRGLFDGQWLCPSCGQWVRIKQLLRPLLFREVE